MGHEVALAVGAEHGELGAPQAALTDEEPHDQHEQHEARTLAPSAR